MSPSFTAIEPRTRTEDVLAHLPISKITEFEKGRTIYSPDSLSHSIYLVVSGTVCLSQVAEDGTDVMLEIVRPDELFGESAFLDPGHRSDRAVAMEKTQLMSWHISDMEDLLMKRPRLAVALLQILAQHNAAFTRRIESFSIDSIEQRLARSLIRLSERLGKRESDGSVRMMAFTHSQLSRYVGTSREIVTHHMNSFKRRGFINYDRQGISLYRENLVSVFGR